MSPNLTADHALVREINLSSVIRTIHARGPVSRAQMATLTGLNKSTISSLVEELLTHRLVHETGINSIGAGRPSTLLEINPQAGCIVGIELGVDFVSVALADFVGAVLWFRVASADPEALPETTLAQTLELVDGAIHASGDKGLPLFGIGVATPGIVDIDEGLLIYAPNLHWQNVPLREIFSRHTGLKVFVENDANAAAVAEHLFGVATQCTDFVFVYAGVGIGGGLFLDGKLYRGKNGFAGEIGHAPIVAGLTQSPCHCGNRGCWETIANQYSVIQRVQASLEVRRSSIVPRLMSEKNSPLSLSLIKEAADAGDKEAIDAFSEAGTMMGLGLSTLLNYLNPEKIILGGPLSLAGDYLLPSICESIAHHTQTEIYQRAQVILSGFGTDASLIGAVAIVVEDVFAHPSRHGRR